MRRGQEDRDLGAPKKAAPKGASWTDAIGDAGPAVMENPRGKTFE